MPDPRERDAVARGRARPKEPPPPGRLEEIARAIKSGSYRVDPERVAQAMLRRAPDPPERRD